MAYKTHIEWTNATWNPVTGCTKVSPGCDHCYAKRLTERFGRGPFDRVATHLERLTEPSRWRRPQMVFTCSMSDLFHPNVPWAFTLAVFSVMEETPQHTYQVLTKRPGRMAYFASNVLKSQGRNWPSNVWAGTSVEAQRFVPRLDLLARVPSVVRFASLEPLLEPIELGPSARGGKIHWVIVGGESGPGARPMDIEWVYSLRHQCEEAKVPFFVKQLGTSWAAANGIADYKGGDPSNWPPIIRIREFPRIALPKTQCSTGADVAQCDPSSDCPIPLPLTA